MSKKFDFLKTVKDAAPESKDIKEPAKAKGGSAPAAPAARAGKSPKTRPARTEKRGRPATGKRSNPEFEPVTLYMRKKTKAAARVALLTEGKDRELSDLVEELVSGWISKHSKM